MAPRLIVEVRWGRLAGVKAVVPAGETLRVGRTELSDLVIGHDGQMSREHFAIAWDGARAMVRDLGSETGTKLGGKAVEEEEDVPHGGWIEAGETHFMVYVEGKTEPPELFFEDEEEERRESKRGEAAEKALGELRDVAGREKLYAVLDGARDDRILELLREHVEPHRSLYDGVEGETLEEVAPYLVGPMREDSELLDKLVMEGWGKRWGIWCTSEEKFVEIRRHWRRFLMVELEETGDRVYFRFYDPGVMRIFWGSCEEGQKAELFGRSGSWFLEQDDGNFERLRSGVDGHP
jgi:pSer/pThr/pTyr-binding forkhead associated (FHA) protein